jgi:hypothetical protein
LTRDQPIARSARPEAIGLPVMARTAKSKI